MGTNFYVVREDPCDRCGHVHEGRLHIGKSSAGWMFSLHVMDEIQSLMDWIREWSKPGRRIENEYGDVLTSAEMIRWIAGRSPDLKRNRSWGRRDNVRPGPGTYDYVEGWFS